MADNDFRSYRNRDSAARGKIRADADDPLAELARLIGQSEPFGRAGRRAAAEAAPSAPDWVADRGDDAEQDQADDRYDRYMRPRPPADNEDYDYESKPQRSAYEPPPSGRRFVPGSAATFNGFRDDAGYTDAEDEAPYRDERENRSAAHRPPATAMPEEHYATDEGYETDENYADAQQHDDGQADLVEHDGDDAPRSGPRGTVAIVAAVLGLIVVGSAGAFAYHSMFGTSLLPKLPPIIKPAAGPNKIVPSAAAPQATGTSKQAAGAPAAGSSEKLVSHEEQPVNIQTAPPAPRVVSTIPIAPESNPAPPPPAAAPPAAVPPSAAPPHAAAAAAPAAAPSAAAPPPQAAAAPAAAPAGASSPQAAAALPPAASAPALASTEPRKVHTVIIRTDKQGGFDTVAASQPPAPAPTPTPTPAPATRSTTHSATAARTSRSAAAPTDRNEPLSIVPGAEGGTPARTRVAAARTEPLRTSGRASGGGFAVQVTSQRNEADAAAAFRALQAKFPGELGGREPIIHRTDLGAKGIYYRVLVGPFASVEEAEGMCSNLKAAGGKCLVQRN